MMTTKRDEDEDEERESKFIPEKMKMKRIDEIN